MAKFLPINDCLKALAAAGHEVAKRSRKQDRVAGFGGPAYYIDGEVQSLSSVRAMAAELVTAKDTKSATDKPKREIDRIIEAIAADPRCAKRQVRVSPWGERNFHGQVVYFFYMVNKEGKVVKGMKTLRAIRDWAIRQGVI